jgi:hypothetical protein
MKSARFDRIESGYIHSFPICARVLCRLLLVTTLSALPLWVKHQLSRKNRRY